MGCIDKTRSPSCTLWKLQKGSAFASFLLLWTAPTPGFTGSSSPAAFNLAQYAAWKVAARYTSAQALTSNGALTLPSMNAAVAARRTALCRAAGRKLLLQIWPQGLATAAAARGWGSPAGPVPSLGAPAQVAEAGSGLEVALPAPSAGVSPQGVPGPVPQVPSQRAVLQLIVQLLEILQSQGYCCG